MNIDTIKKLAVIGQTARPMATWKCDYIAWPMEKLDSILGGMEGGAPCDGIALMRMANKSYWAHRIVETDWHLFATHPVAANAKQASELKAKAIERPIHLVYEYIAATPEVASELEKIAPLLYFSAKICVGDVPALRQALLELFDALRCLLSIPVDEIFARTRNVRASAEDPDLIMAQLRMKNGCEGQIEAHCLSAKSPRTSIDFYGRNGQFHWDASSRWLNEGVAMSGSPFSDSIKSYQWADWLGRCGRFDRAINYREALK